MIFTSSNDNTQQAAAHLVVFKYEQRRVLLPLPQNYEGAIGAVREEFLLPTDSEVSFETRELPGCAGEAVEIHPRAWEAITPILNQIIVKVAGRPTTHLDPSQRLPSEVPTEVLAENIPTPTGKGKGKGKAKEATPLRDDQPAAVSKIRKRPSMAGPGNALPRKSIVRLSIASNAHSRSEAVVQKPFPSPLAAQSSSQGRAGVTPPPLATHQEDEEEEQVLRSPRKGKSARKRVMSDDELEYTDIETPAPQSSQPIAGRSSAVVKQEKISPPTKRARTPPGELVGNTAAAVLRPGEKIVNPAETCLITVDYDDGNEVCSSAFKTKGRHTVHKVLMTVCKTFGIEALYPRVNLVRVITDSTDDPNFEGQMIEQRFVCPRDHTMTQVGAHDDAKFAVEVVEDETDSTA